MFNWVRCQKRMPKKNIETLVYNSKNSESYLATYNVNNGCFYGMIVNRFDDDKREPITDWAEPEE